MKKLLLNLKASILWVFSTKHQKFGKLLIKNSLKTATAESCTGGLLSSRLTDVAGSSAYVFANFVTYSNQSKQELLGVSVEVFDNFGAVSAQCAREMAEGLIKKTGCDISICTTGIAGPATDEGKAAGLVYIAVSYKNSTLVKQFNFSPLYTRKNMKFMFTEMALELALDTLNTL